MNLHDALKFLYGVNIGLAVGYWWAHLFPRREPEPDLPTPPIVSFGRQYQRASKGSTSAKAARGTQADTGSIPVRSTVQNVPANVHETHTGTNLLYIDSKYSKNVTRPDRYTLNYLRLYIRNEYSDGRSIPPEGVKLSYRDLKRYKMSRTRANVLRAWVENGLGYKDAGGVVYLSKSKARDFMRRMAENE